MRRLGIVAALAAMLAAGMIIALNRAAGADREATREVARASQTLGTAELLERHLVDLETGLRGYAPTADRIFLAPWYTGRAAIPGDFATLEQLTSGQRRETAELQAIQRGVRTYADAYAAPLIAHSPVTGRRLDAVNREGKRLFDGLRAELTTFNAGQLERQHDAEERAAAARQRSSRLVVWTVAGLVIALLGLVLYIRRVVIVPVRRVIAACAELATGRRSGELEVAGAPELRRLAGAFNAMAAELEQRERQLRQYASIVEHSADAITGQDANGTITEWNAGAERLYGYMAAEALGQPMSLIVPPERHGEEMGLLERALAEETVQQFQTERRRKDGSTLEVSITVSPVRDDQGKPIGASVITRDVSARRRAQRELESALAELADAQRIAHVGSWTWEVGMGQGSWSEEMYRIFGRDPSDGPLPSEQFFACVHPDDRDAVARGYADTFGGGASFRVEYRIIRGGDGAERVLHATGRKERPGRYVGTAQDVTDLRELEREALKSERRFRSTLENAPIGMALVALDGRFLEVNRALADTVGYGDRELLALSFRDITHPDDIEAGAEDIARLLAGEITSYQVEKRYVHRLGRVVWIELSVSLLRDEDGEPVHFISQMKDITAERTAREALEESERRYQSIATNVPGAVYRFAMNPDGEFSLPFISAGAAEIYELGPERLMADPWLILDSVHPDDQDRFRESVAESAGGLRRWDWHGRHVMPDGRVKYLHGVSQPFPEPDGTIVWDGVIFDETEIRLAQEKEAEIAQRLQSILENLAGSAVTLYDHEQRLRFCEGPLFADVDLASMLGKPLAEFVSPETYALMSPGIDKAFAGQVSTAVLESDRHGRTLAIHFAPYRIADGAIDGVLVHWHDITAVRSAERARDEARGRFQIAFERAPIGMAIVGLDGRFERVNDSLCEMTGYAAADLLAMVPFATVHPDDVWHLQREFARLGEVDTLTVETRIAHRAGQVVWVQAQMTMIRDDAGEPVHALAQVLDITERRGYEERLKHMADHDPLTGLLNRRAFEAALDAHLARCRRYGASGALLVLDLDGFKRVNDASGHAVGDELLIGCANALSRRVRETDVIARLGGDEFAILLPAENLGEAESVAQALIDTVREHTAASGAAAAGGVTASLGITMFGDAELTAAQMLVDADLAMYTAKDAGKNRYAVAPHRRVQVGTARSS